MDRTLFAALLILLGSVANAQLSGPWDGVFEDTTLSSLEPKIGEGVLYSRIRVYRDLEENQTNFSRTLRAAPGLTIHPQINSRSEHIGESQEQIKEINAMLAFEKNIGTKASAQLFLNPQRSSLESNLLTGAIRVENQNDAGVGFRVAPMNKTTLAGSAKGTYWLRTESSGLQSTDPGWGTEWAAKSVLDPMLLDSISFLGEILSEERALYQRFFSNVRLMAFRALDAKTSAALAFRRAGGFVKDEPLHLDEATRAISVHALINHSLHKANLKIYGDRTQNEESVSRGILVNGTQGAVSLELQGDAVSCGGVAGIARVSEDNQQNFSLSRDERHFWLDAEAQWRPGPDLRLEWKGHGKRISADYPRISPEGDSLRDRFDNDNITIDHWTCVTWTLPSSCTLSVQGRYSEYLFQYLLSRYSGGNRVQEVYNLSPAIKWSAARLHHNQEFEITANYAHNPFSASRNYLNRQLRSGSVVTYDVGSRDKAIFTYNERITDQGNMDTLDVYLVWGKGRKSDWLLEWQRRIFGGVDLRPGFGMIIDRRNRFNLSTRTYLPTAGQGSLRVYSVSALRNQGRLTLNARTAFFRERTGTGYWDGLVTVQGGF